MNLRIALFLSLFALGVNANEPTTKEQPVSDLKETYDLMSAVEQTDGDNRTYKLYEHDGVMFKVFKPENDSISIEGLGGVGNVSVDKKRRVYLYSSPGVIAYQADTAKQAFEKVLNQLIENARRPPVEQLRKGLDEFYEDLGKGEGSS